MAAGTDTPSSLSILDGSYRKNITVTRDEKSNTFDNMKQPNIGKPPRHVSAIRYCVSSAQLAPVTEMEFDSGVVSSKSSSDSNSPFVPVFRSGSCSEIGPKQFMEDEHICIDNILEHLGSTTDFPSSGAFYGVFDGHGGTDAASFIRENILRFIVEDSHFPFCAKQAIKSAFLKADHAFADTGTLDSSSGTTALTALIYGRTMLVANAGDCRAVLGRRGRAVELSKDHKPNCATERLRIEKLGGVVYDGYLNGQLSVARALGDWHMKGSKGSTCPLSAEPELEETILSEEDEFLILGCDGLWDVMSSQCAVTIARKELMLHNDPERCSRELVREALKRDTCDNLTVVVVCFSPEPPPQLEIPKFKFKRSISAEGLNLLQEVLNSNV
ncbi:PREDICTED: probable protein phosphatase 2C 27 [Fragaria vesca subsp. vesca]|uniref:probable protein phosphatase 2C 27 n=1 Tax=Fragaria vesca subsp. vesca TaxID=101020 RepID=UPI0002C35E19|nr:PREDICTED: probable protein phosphatase 2C 27 [Fragaria vesca subsp. vesca]XP_011458096.1 PREDICTED: probable protein phosphatase 2C 27 [Fragaria vesca subsp. vesca]